MSNNFLTDEALEEGRVALDRLERQLKLRGVGRSSDSRSDSSSRQQSTNSDRRILDQLPRLARLSNRSESLGLTVEELDDRGLLDGGGFVPTYYTSVKQKNRKVLELQPRSHRLLERGKEALAKLLNALFHTLRTYARWGRNIAEEIRSLDLKSEGCISKKQFLYALKQVDLPFSPKELADVAQHYSLPTNEKIDFLLFIKDANLENVRTLIKDGKTDEATETDREPTTPQNPRIYSVTGVLHDVKRMLGDASRSLNKTPDELYRMFARWDSDGSGTITATQFLRVLARLHADLSDQDQDFIIELLDSQGMGRIDFESLLTYCFGDDLKAKTDSNANSTGTPGGAMPNAHEAVDFDITAETLSAVSLDGNTSVDMKSHSNSSTNYKRPQTASQLPRPYENRGNIVQQMSHEQSRLIYGSPGEDGKLAREIYVGNNFRSNDKVRPLTALARVSTAGHNNNGNQGSNSPIKQRQHGNVEAEESLVVMDLPDDVIHGEEIYLPPTQHDYLYQDTPLYNSQKASKAPQQTQLNYNPAQENIHGATNMSNQEDLNRLSKYPGFVSPVGDHLVLLANQILGTLRDIILVRYRRGRSLFEIYQHFDRKRKGYFDDRDFIQATADLRIETSEKVAKLSVGMIGIDSKDKVTFGEFKVFILDPDHNILASNVQEQTSQFYEQYGRGFDSWIISEFWKGEEQSNQSLEQFKTMQVRGVVSRDVFVRTLKRIGLVLTSADVERLAERFDINGADECAIYLFVNMIRASDAWQRAERNLDYQDRALEEADMLRYNKSIGQAHDADELSDEVISMCEYLGIGVFNEKNMIWIAIDALRAPLPVNWTAQKDADGRTFFFNVMTNQSRWEHPLDPHFRNLRDKYRQSAFESRGTAPSTALAHKGMTTGKKEISEDAKLKPPQQQWTSSGELMTTNSFKQQQQQLDLKQHNSQRPSLPSTEEMLRTVGSMMTNNNTGVLRSGSAPAKTSQLGDRFEVDSDYPFVADHQQLAANLMKQTADRTADSGARPSSAPSHKRASAKSKTFSEREQAIEAIYTAPYLKNATLWRPANALPDSNSNHIHKARIQSAGGNGPRSNSAKDFLPLTDQARKSKLAEMYDGKVLEKLDTIIAPAATNNNPRLRS